MSGILNGRFHPGFESSAAASYLVIGTDSSEKVQNYQAEMIANNRINGILPLDIRYKDSTISFYYNITSRQQLSQFLKRKKLKRDEFIEILSGIIRTVLESGSYLLSDKSLLLEEDYLFINPESLEISLVYIPVILDADICKNFKDLLLKLIMFSADIEDTGSDNFLQRILGFTKQEIFNLAEFDKLLKELKNPDMPPQADKYKELPVKEKTPPKDSRDDKQQKAVPELGVSTKYGPEGQEGRAGTPIEHIRRPLRPPVAAAVPRIPLSEEKVKPKEKTGKANLKYKRSTMVTAIFLQVGIILLLGVFYASGAVKSLGEDVMTTLAAAALILGALDFLVLRKLFDKGNMVVAEDAKEQTPGVPAQINMSKREIRNLPERPRVPVLVPMSQLNDTAGEAQEATALLFQDACNETVLLSSAGKSSPFLQGIRNGTIEKIPITKPSFIIGRLGEQVDYVSDNGAVGKVHAEIISRGGCYFIKDLNTRNGTFINGSRIASNKEYSIQDQDKIALANSEFTFTCPNKEVI